MIPYVTEAIWDNLPNRDSMLVVARWPKSGPFDDEAEADVDLAIGVTRAVRNVRAEFKVDVGRRIPITVVAGGRIGALEAQRALIEQLARVQPLDLVQSLAEPPRQAVHALVGSTEVYVPLAGMIDLAAERTRLAGELARARTQLDSLDRRLNEPSFVSKAPAAVVEKERERRFALSEQIGKIDERIANLS
jgi:valyl-tRNA synthetase